MSGEEKENKKVDTTGHICPLCYLGKMFEGSLYDDWEGKLTCTKCNHRLSRYRKKDAVE